MWQFVVTLKDCEDMPCIVNCDLCHGGAVTFLLAVSTQAYDYVLIATSEHITLCLGLSVVSLLRYV